MSKNRPPGANGYRVQALFVTDLGGGLALLFIIISYEASNKTDRIIGGEVMGKC